MVYVLDAVFKGTASLLFLRGIYSPCNSRIAVTLYAGIILASFLTPYLTVSLPLLHIHVVTLYTHFLNIYI